MLPPRRCVRLLTVLLVAAAGRAPATEPAGPGDLSGGLRFPHRILESEPFWTLTSLTWPETVPAAEADGPAAPPASASPSDTVPEPEPPAEAAPANGYRVASQPNPAASPHKGLYFDNDFSYLEELGNTDSYFGDLFKRRSVAGMTFDVGGEFRLRQHDEHLLTRTSNFLLQRTRLYGNLEVRPGLRAYAEAVDAASSWDDVAPRGIEENRFDALNLFGDVRVYDGPDADAWIRGGRQELLYGAQRLVSPFDWANTRRTFDGVKLFWQGPQWNIDAFWTRPVPFAQHLGNDHNFDHPDTSQEFIGVYMTRKGLENDNIDLYYLRLVEWDAPPGAPVDRFNYDTFGGRWEAKRENWLWEIEGGYQFGLFGGVSHSAGFYTIGGGRKLARLPWNPVVWVYYDWASGDNAPTDGFNRTFNQLFPLSHKYFGWMDLVARQNIEDWNARLTLAPHTKVDFIFWWHVFHLQQPRDALYNAAGVPIRRDVTGAAGRDVGQELDLMVKFKLRPRTDLVCGYAHLYAGDFLGATTPIGAPLGEDFYYTQFALRF